MINSPFDDFLENCGANQVPDSLYVQCLASPWGDRFELLQFDIDLDAINKLIDATETELKANESTFFEDQQSEIQKVAGLCLSLLKNSQHANVRISALRELLLLGSLAGSKGIGVSTLNVFDHIVGEFSRLVRNEICKKKSKKDDQEDESEVDDYDMSGNDDAFKTNVNNSHLITAVKQFVRYTLQYKESRGNSWLDSYIDGLASILYLAASKDEFSALKIVVEDAFVQVTHDDTSGVLTVLRCLLPILSMKCNDSKIPENAKSRTQCHKAATRVVERIVSDISILNEQILSAVDKEPEINTSYNSPTRSAVTDNNPDEVEIKAPKSKLPTGFAAVVGVLQRLLLLCPDKAQIRAQVAGSICSIVKALTSALSKKAHANFHTQTGESFSVIQLALHRYLTFVSKIITSSKLSNRLFAVEVGSLLIRLSSVWFVRSSETEEGPEVDNSTTFQASKAIVTAILGRCHDIAATVRTRALTAVSDLLDDLGSIFGPTNGLKNISTKVELKHLDGFPLELCRCLYQHILAESFNESKNATPNFIETLKLLTADERPTTRVKAIRAYGTALSIKWPKMDLFHPLYVGMELDCVSMLVTDDDVMLFSKCCSDPSVSVRKQVIDSLTQMLISRPVDSSLQDAWVCSVLPLMADSESTVQNKVALSVYALIFETCNDWVSASPDDTQSSLKSLGWILCGKLANCGLYKMIKLAVQELIKMGCFNVNSSSNKLANTISVSQLVSIVEIGCTQCIGSKKSVHSGKLCFHDDPDTVSHASWVILEALVDNESAIASATRDKNPNALQTLYNSDFVFLCYESRIATGTASIGSDNVDIRILRVIHSMATHNPDISNLPRFRSISTHLLQSVLQMRSPPHVIAVAISVIFAPMVHGIKSYGNMIVSDSSTKLFDSMLQCASRILDTCYTIINAAVSEEPLTVGLFGGTPIPVPSGVSSDRFLDSSISVAMLNAAVFAVGEISMLGFSPDEEESFSAIAAKNTNYPNFTVSKLSIGAFKIVIPDLLLRLIQLLMPEEFLHSSGRQQHHENKSVDYSVRAHAFTTIGKICIRDKSKATKLVNIFLRELQAQTRACSANNVAVRSNALIILGDLCVRFTNLVDRHIGVLASCLQDVDVTVRKNAFVLLIQLLAQDFLKWRGMLLYRFLATVVDEDEEMSMFGKVALKRALDGKICGIFRQHFLEAIVIFNNCKEHPAYIANETSGGNDTSGESLVDLRGVELSGPSNATKRFRIYEYIMEGMSEEDKIQATAKLVQDILAYAVDNAEKIHPLGCSGLTTLEQAIADVFKILRSPMLKVTLNKKNANNDSNIEDIDDLDAGIGDTDGMSPVSLAKQAMFNAKVKVLKKLSVQHMIEHVLPVISSLKHSLERCHSKLQRPLMEYLCEIVQNHKSEVNQVLLQDPCLKAEIEYDIKIFERTKEIEVIRAKVLSAEATSNDVLQTSNFKSGRKSMGSLPTHLKVSHEEGRLDASGKQLSLRRKSFGASSMQSPSLKPLKRTENSLQVILNEENTEPHSSDLIVGSSSTPLARWNVNLSEFSEQSKVLDTVSTGIPKSNERSPLQEKSQHHRIHMLSDRKDGSSPMKKKSKAEEIEPIKSVRTRKRTQDSFFEMASDSLLNLTAK